ncbi:hypothetical protein GCM10009682_23320 [Luedemannella flava]|uniref:Flagellar protein FliL n=1 Tax=Luedemannella flava TaxID=349316 RepID=A0ABN2LYX4_9ACTN
MSKNDTDSTVDTAKPKRTKMLVMLGIVVMAAVAVTGVKLMLDPRDETPQAGTVLVLDTVTVNLADGHYLKMKLALQSTAEADGHGGLEGSHAQDLAITAYTGRTIGELSSVAGRRQAKAQLLEVVKKAYDGKVMDIYFTEFVTQ